MKSQVSQSLCEELNNSVISSGTLIARKNNYFLKMLIRSGREVI